MKNMIQSARIRQWAYYGFCAVAVVAAEIYIPKLSAAEGVAKVDAMASKSPTATLPAQNAVSRPDLLPEQFKVYYNPNLGISKKAYKGGAEKVILTNNDVKESKGCYLSCYSKNSTHAVYPIDTNVFLMGQIRVEGQYHNAICQPKGFEDKDIRIAKEFKAKCEEAFPERCEKESCWASGDHTTNWF